MRVLPQVPMKASEWARSARAWIFAFAVTITAGGPALAEDQIPGPAGIEQRWIPSVSFFSMGHAEARSAQMSADTEVVTGRGNLNVDGSSLGLPWSFGGTADIASPVVLDLPGRPRLFAHADAGYTYDVEDPVATVGVPKFAPVLQPNQNNIRAIQNVGASVRVEGKPLSFSGGLGTVFSFEAFGRGFRLRPTLEWMYRRDTMRNTLGGGEIETAGRTPTQCNPCRTVFIKTQTEKGFHSLGPGMELEADVGRAGEFLVGFYGAFRAYYLIGDRKANLISTGSWTRTDNGQPSSRVDTPFVTQYEREPWHYSFGFGLRVLWSPEE